MTTLRARTTDTLSTVAEWFQRSPEGQAITQKALVDAKAATHAARLAIVAELERVRAADREAIAAHDRQGRPLVARAADLERQLAEVQAQRHTLEAAHRAERFVRSQAIDGCLTRLEASAPREAIAAFQNELTSILEDLRLQGDAVFSRGVDGKLYQRWWNRPSIIACSEAICALRCEIHDLRREALTEPELEARLAAMRQRIPAVETRPDGWERL